MVVIETKSKKQKLSEKNIIRRLVTVEKRARSKDRLRRGKELFGALTTLFLALMIAHTYNSSGNPVQKYLILLVITYVVMAVILSIGILHFFNKKLPWQR